VACPAEQLGDAAFGGSQAEDRVEEDDRVCHGYMAITVRHRLWRLWLRPGMVNCSSAPRARATRSLRRFRRQAHEGQIDKSGQPYIGHPLRVMSKVAGPHAQMAAVLHDVIEDTPATAGDLLAAGCPPLSPRGPTSPTAAMTNAACPHICRRHFLTDLPFSGDSSVDSAATKASCGTSTRPTIFMRFLPSFCFSSSLRFRVMSPP
jgi:hypothetical protein